MVTALNIDSQPVMMMYIYKWQCYLKFFNNFSWHFYTYILCSLSLFSRRAASAVPSDSQKYNVYGHNCSQVSHTTCRFQCDPIWKCQWRADQPTDRCRCYRCSTHLKTDIKVNISECFILLCCARAHISLLQKECRACQMNGLPSERGFEARQGSLRLPFLVPGHHHCSPVNHFF